MKAIKSQGVQTAMTEPQVTLDPTKDPTIFSDPAKLLQYIDEVTNIKAARAQRQALAPLTEETEKEQRRMAFAAFVKEHPDFSERKERIKVLLQEDPNLPLVKAYEYAKNEHDAVASKKELEKVNALQAQRARSAAVQGKPGSSGATTALTMPAGLKGSARSSWLAAHPDYRYETDPARKRK